MKVSLHKLKFTILILSIDSVLYILISLHSKDLHKLPSMYQYNLKLISVFGDVSVPLSSYLKCTFRALEREGGILEALAEAPC